MFGTVKVPVKVGLFLSALLLSVVAEFVLSGIVTVPVKIWLFLYALLLNVVA